MEKIYRVNMTTQTVTEETVPEKYRYSGGRGLIGQIMTDEVDPTCNPIGPNNKFIIAPGFFNGTTAPSGGRLSIGAKSPLTNGIKESNAGGNTGHMLGKMGVKAVIIEGAPSVGEDDFFVLRITPEGIEIFPAPSELVGKGCYFTGRYCKEHYAYNHTATTMSIGPAGEMRCAAACISLTNMEGDSSRQAGRGGMGCILGSKKIKAIVVDNCKQNTITYAEQEKFREISYNLGKSLMISGKGLTNYGTDALVTPINNVGGLPVHNFTYGATEDFKKLTGQEIHRLAAERGGQWGHSCHPGCCIRCSNVFCDSNGKYITGSLEFETVALFGSNCDIYNLDTIAKADFKCDDYGVDSIDTGVVAGIAMEAGLIKWGDEQGLLDFLDEMGKKTPLGRIIASGATLFGRVYGQWRVSATKGQATAAYDPRACKGTGATYATSTHGGDHTIGNALPGRGNLDTHKVDKQCGLSRNLQVFSTMIDSSGFCLFVGPSVTKMPFIADLLNAKYGTNFTPEDLYSKGKEILRKEIAFNRAAGVPDIDIAEFQRVQPLAPSNEVFDIPMEELKKIHDLEYTFAPEESAIW